MEGRLWYRKICYKKYIIITGLFMDFVAKVPETVELGLLKDALVGLPGVSGLSTEQRRQCTIAIELVSNPSIIFMDEPMTGLDARTAAIVMRIIRNVVDTGRTVVCTLHQPSIDIFEAFDELMLLKPGGQVIYFGPFGEDSSNIVEYFECIPRVPRIRNGCNPATWMLEVTSLSAEAQLGIDFAQIYKESSLYRSNMELVMQLSVPLPGSTDLHFPNKFSQRFWVQFRCCLWKQRLSYWRSLAYNLTRIMNTLVSSLIFGLLFWDQGKNIENSYVWRKICTYLIFMGLFTCTDLLRIHHSSSENSQVVDLVVLFDANVLVNAWFVDFTIWRCKCGNHDHLRRDYHSFCLFKRLLWV